MIKTAILACFLCAAGTGTVWWVKALAGNQAPADRVDITPTLISGFWELHANAHLEGLTEPFEPRTPVSTIANHYWCLQVVGLSLAHSKMHDSMGHFGVPPNKSYIIRLCRFGSA
jgi:hypothetical protein